MSRPRSLYALYAMLVPSAVPGKTSSTVTFPHCVCKCCLGFLLHTKPSRQHKRKIPECDSRRECENWRWRETICKDLLISLVLLLPWYYYHGWHGSRQIPWAYFSQKFFKSLEPTGSFADIAIAVRLITSIVITAIIITPDLRSHSPVPSSLVSSSTRFPFGQSKFPQAVSPSSEDFSNHSKVSMTPLALQTALIDYVPFSPSETSSQM